MSETAAVLVVHTALAAIGLVFRSVLRRAPRLTDEEVAETERRKANFDADRRRLPSGE